MVINHLLPDESEVEILKKDLDGLNEVYKDIADEIGVENTLIIYKLFRGTQISFPSRLFQKSTYIRLLSANITAKTYRSWRKSIIIPNEAFNA